MKSVITKIDHGGNWKGRDPQMLISSVNVGGRQKGGVLSECLITLDLIGLGCVSMKAGPSTVKTRKISHDDDDRIRSIISMYISAF